MAADGMGLFLVKERTKTGGAIGGPEQFQGFALLLDSYKNGQTIGNFPLVSLLFIFEYKKIISFINDITNINMIWVIYKSLLSNKKINLKKIKYIYS